MALVIDATAGGASSNSYTEINSADTFLEQNIHTFATWDTESDDNKSACIILATRLLDEQVTWNGYKMTEAQALQWPRGSVLDPAGYTLSNSTIPAFLANATAQLAQSLSIDNRLAESATLGFTKIQVGSIDLRVKKSDRRKVIPISVWNIINFYGVKTSTSNRLVLC